ncbi:hypothetical protein ACFO4L_14775 [Bacillus daqingensis]|uniref:Uncharacterized protein n=1 Tax=Bacillus daqingensis TaxID=872396 RepID=A0ABV9P0F4_9BACI
MEWEWTVTTNDENEHFAVGFLLTDPCAHQAIALVHSGGQIIATTLTDDFGYFHVKLSTEPEDIHPILHSPHSAVI